MDKLLLNLARESLRLDSNNTKSTGVLPRLSSPSESKINAYLISPIGENVTSNLSSTRSLTRRNNNATPQLIDAFSNENICTTSNGAYNAARTNANYQAELKKIIDDVLFKIEISINIIFFYQDYCEIMN